MHYPGAPGQDHNALYRDYLIKEQIWQIFKSRTTAAWVCWVG